MTNPLKYHQNVANEEHIFLFAVSRRSSSTAFQRILNSSNEVWIWGEPHGVLKKLLFIISHIKQLGANDVIIQAQRMMYRSFVDDKHLSFYANAVGNLEESVQLLISSISNFLKPWAPKIKRFGFKEIEIMPIEMLDYLKEIYPKSHFAFCFRNPLLQWPSMLKLSVNKDLNFFLEQYNDIAGNYIAFAKMWGLKCFIEDTDLRDATKVARLITHLNISKVDTSLINVTVHSVEHAPLSKPDTDKILNSPAYKRYLKMQKISKSFFKLNR